MVPGGQANEAKLISICLSIISSSSHYLVPYCTVCQLSISWRPCSHFVSPVPASLTVKHARAPTRKQNHKKRTNKNTTRARELFFGSLCVAIQIERLTKRTIAKTSSRHPIIHHYTRPHLLDDRLAQACNCQSNACRSTEQHSY